MSQYEFALKFIETDEGHEDFKNWFDYEYPNEFNNYFLDPNDEAHFWEVFHHYEFISKYLVSQWIQWVETDFWEWAMSEELKDGGEK